MTIPIIRSLSCWWAIWSFSTDKFKYQKWNWNCEKFKFKFHNKFAGSLCTLLETLTFKLHQKPICYGLLKRRTSPRSRSSHVQLFWIPFLLHAILLCDFFSKSRKLWTNIAWREMLFEKLGCIFFENQLRYYHISEIPKWHYHTRSSKNGVLLINCTSYTLQINRGFPL